MDRSREHTAAFTGHRRYDGECDDALRAVVGELYGWGFRVFWSGMALGFDLAAAEAVLALRGELPGLRLCCAVPFPGQADRFPEADRLRYMRILDRADEVATLAPRYEPRCYLRRDEFMVERSAAVVAWFDGGKGGTRIPGIMRGAARRSGSTCGATVNRNFSEALRPLFCGYRVNFGTDRPKCLNSFRLRLRYSRSA